MNYAGVGSRRTPATILKQMKQIGYELGIATTNNKSWILNTGGAAGADQAFCEGASAAGGKVQVFAPTWYTVHGCSYDVKKITDIPPGAYSIAQRFHPAWGRLSSGAKALMARNILVLLGESFIEPVRFVVAWTPNGKMVGGTGHTLRAASDFNIPVFNLNDMSAAKVIEHAIKLLEQ